MIAKLAGVAFLYGWMGYLAARGARSPPAAGLARSGSGA